MEASNFDIGANTFPLIHQHLASVQQPAHLTAQSASLDSLTSDWIIGNASQRVCGFWQGFWRGQFFFFDDDDLLN
jgi:hypothetical protein